MSVLIRRRAEIRDEISRSRQTLQKLASEFQDVDSAIRSIKVRDPAARQARPGGGSDVTRIVFEALNEADAPMTSQALAARVIDELGLDARDKTVAKYIVRRVCVCLWEQVQKGHFRKAEPATRPMRWECLRPGQ